MSDEINKKTREGKRWQTICLCNFPNLIVYVPCFISGTKQFLSTLQKKQMQQAFINEL